MPPRSKPHTRRVGCAAPCARTTYAASACSSDANRSVAASSQRNSAPATIVSPLTCYPWARSPSLHELMLQANPVSDLCHWGPCNTLSLVFRACSTQPACRILTGLLCTLRVGVIDRKIGQAGAPTQPVKLQSAALRRACRLASSAGPWHAAMVQASRCARALSVTSTPSSAQRRTWHLRQHVVIRTQLAVTLLPVTTMWIQRPAGSSFVCKQCHNMHCTWVIRCPVMLRPSFCDRVWNVPASEALQDESAA